MDAGWHVFGGSACPNSGVGVAIAQLLQGSTCDAADREAHEARRLDEEIAAMFCEIEAFLRTVRGRKRLAFAAWCREHGR